MFKDIILTTTYICIKLCQKYYIKKFLIIDISMLGEYFLMQEEPLKNIQRIF